MAGLSSYQHSQLVQQPCLPQQSPLMHAAATVVPALLAVAGGAGGQTSDVLVAAPAAFENTNRKTARRRINMTDSRNLVPEQESRKEPISQMPRQSNL
jgi:hypothetical protein